MLSLRCFSVRLGQSIQILNYASLLVWVFIYYELDIEGGTSQKYLIVMLVSAIINNERHQEEPRETQRVEFPTRLCFFAATTI
mmetsp:Transcript_637/g.1268  ORF Transcript_637/g.1268 Transcript_637/m.1268 type:complete len:83 (+) Transcript_637:544-792(+)